MTDKKISALTDLGGAPASTDVLPIVDSSANQTKKVSVEDLFTNPNVTGTLTADGLTVQTTQGDISITNGVSSLNFAKAGTSYIRATDAAGNLYFVTGANNYTTNRMALASNGDIAFYEDTGTTAKFFWDASAESLGIGTTAPNSILQIEENVANAEGAELRVINDASAVGNGQTATLTLGREFNERNIKIKSVSSGDYGGNPELVITQSRSDTHVETIRINGSGNVGIGTPTVSNPFSVAQAVQIGAVSGTGGLLTLGGSSGSVYFGDSGSGYAGYINYQHSDDSLRFGTGTSERVRIDSSGKVGIGTSSPYTALDVSGGTTNQVAVFRSTDTTATIGFADDTTPLTGNLSYVTVGAVGNNMVFNTNLDERMRIDSSGNLLVGTTSSTLYNGTSGTGFSYRAGNELTVARSGASVATFVRQSDDGDILSFKKDGTAVGSIGVNATNNLTIDSSASNHAGLEFAGGSVYGLVLPRTAGTASDGNVDLGDPTRRFKKLYLSDGVYLGGTGAANLLDDYEEGTFTPVLSTDNSDMVVAGYTSTEGFYTKVGNLVTIALRITCTFTSVGTGNLKITGLPFSISNVGNLFMYGGIAEGVNGFSTDPTYIAAYGDAADQFRIKNNSGNLTASDLTGSEMWIRATIVYRT